MLTRARLAAVALVVWPAVAHAQPAPQPYPPAPYPPGQPSRPPARPYPPQPYPYPPQPYPYPPQPYPSQPPYPPPPPQAPPPEPSTYGRPLDGLGYAVIFGGSGARQEVTTYGHHRGWSGGVFMHLALLGSFGSIAFHFRYDVNLHGGANGLDSRGIGEFTIGSGLRLFEGSELFYRAGVAGASLRNDEVRATLNELPAVQLGYQLKTKDILFEIGPEGALALGTEWEPGDEDQGRRLRRKLKSAFGAGGFGSVSIHHFILQGKALHLFDADPLLVADGQLCFAYGLAICGFGQYWKADARNPISGEIRSAEATYFGLALGVGIAGETAWAQRK